MENWRVRAWQGQERIEKNKASCPLHSVSKAGPPPFTKRLYRMFQSPSRELTQEDPRNRTKFHTAAPCLAKHPSPLSYSCQMVRNHPPAPGAELFNYSSSFQNTYAARKSPKKKRIILFRLLGHFLNLS